MALHLHKYAVFCGEALRFNMGPERVLCSGSDRNDLLGNGYIRIMLTVKHNPEGTGAAHLDRIIDEDINPLARGYPPVESSVKGFAFESVIPEE